MSTGFIWIAAVLILGGVIATVGDRLGTRVGKARLSLFKMRPRRTATVVTILTGIIISASSLGVLLAFDKRLRDGIFEIGRIQRELRNKRHQLDTTQRQLEATNQRKNQVEQELTQARAEQKTQQIEAQKQQIAAQKRLKTINQSLRAALTKQIKTQSQLNRTRGQLSQITSQYEKAQSQLNTVSQQALKLRGEIKQSQAELRKLVAQRQELKAILSQRDREIAKLDREIGQRDRGIVERNRVIAQREARLKELERQQEYLEQEALLLGQNLQELRRGNVVLFRGQVLAARVVRVVRPTAARIAVDKILSEANRNAINLTQPGIDHGSARVVRISESQVTRLIARIGDGRDYLVRILSAGNYVVGEESVQVITQIAPNLLIYKAGDILARINADPATMSAMEVRQRVELLLGAAKFSAQRAGIITGDTIQIADNRIQTLIQFFEQLQKYNQAVELKAIAAQNTYTSGPLRVELVAVQAGRVVISTSSMNAKTTDELQLTPNLQLPSLYRP